MRKRFVVFVLQLVLALLLFSASIVCVVENKGWGVLFFLLSLFVKHGTLLTPSRGVFSSHPVSKKELEIWLWAATT